MKVFDELDAWRDYRAGREAPGFIPTMGALHPGHLSLVQRGVAENPWTVASIFVNPAQFNDPADLRAYPRQVDADLAQLETAGVEAVLLPNEKALYPDEYRYRLSESELSRRLCGAHRPGHFDGVLTVVLKLLNLVRPASAYFGEKDYQQLQLIRGMAEAFFLQTRIVGCPIVREVDGLAMSSRNLRLDPEQRRTAPQLHRVITTAGGPGEAVAALADLGFEVDYVEDVDDRRFAAARLGEVRLIDNVPLVEPAP
ncbi:pantoate--beta-alanine ligase [Elongatibacter sediminis]|uniref:Pantothenate synthetase n=1 Tax=Elongatibacter sediminis TaxID=3119006 RepID=A0AAW9RIS6_9GAMM